MALIKCTECGTEISDKAPACVKCGAPASTSPTIEPIAKKDGIPWYAWVVGVPAVLLAVMMIIGANADPAKQRDRDAIQLCWDSQGRKDLTAGSARFVAGACYKMEEDFRQKWHATP